LYVGVSIIEVTLEGIEILTYKRYPDLIPVKRVRMGDSFTSKLLRHKFSSSGKESLCIDKLLSHKELVYVKYIIERNRNKEMMPPEELMPLEKNEDIGKLINKALEDLLIDIGSNKWEISFKDLSRISPVMYSEDIMIIMFASDTKLKTVKEQKKNRRSFVEKLMSKPVRKLDDVDPTLSFISLAMFEVNYQNKYHYKEYFEFRRNIKLAVSNLFRTTRDWCSEKIKARENIIMELRKTYNDNFSWALTLLNCQREKDEVLEETVENYWIPFRFANNNLSKSQSISLHESFCAFINYSSISPRLQRKSTSSIKVEMIKGETNSESRIIPLKE
jgi:hypothetical protein